MSHWRGLRAGAGLRSCTSRTSAPLPPLPGPASRSRLHVAASTSHSSPSSSSSSPSTSSSPTASASSASSVSNVGTYKWGNAKNERRPRPENVPGSFFVDSTCIDCDTCRWMAPDVFARVGRQSAVTRQPGGREGRLAAMRALLSCPTYSIHVTDRTGDELKEAQASLPAPVPGLVHVAATGASDHGGDGRTADPGVYYTGWATEKSYAGAAYLVVRPQGGNILVDSPRFNPVLARRLEAMGVVVAIFLTHRDDVGDHEAWARHFKAPRILHETECNSRQGTDKVEIKLQGAGPWALRQGPGGAISAEPLPAEGAEGAAGADDTLLIHTPGHTVGHVCMYYAPAQTLFSGDHLCSAVGETDSAGEDELYVFKDFNWYDFPQQLKSVAKLLQYDWLHVLPAHGRRARFRDAAARLASVSRLLQSHGAGAGVGGRG
ncbi:hypothetical protein HYH03_013214 [Edaphochlamys debaryana]|uniref:Metallo-beta-lactamase domain-containing protein n=1 Tax=Edaphochlamys debaryana TaxID=47281 RepID=A0A835XRA4_9CHLO|nr:hypothetical protein HYH03_013214 [Edaphochlamys debaryana]|eukprot:KAG2488220.1 hypothetical protein HYH03_013214 [Edaphochlamys debaryana]